MFTPINPFVHFSQSGASAGLGFHMMVGWGGGAAARPALAARPYYISICVYIYMYMNILGGQGDLVSRLIMGITRGTIWVMGVISLLTKSP